MLRDIQFTSTYEITMHKVLFSDNEVALAKCLNFTYDANESTVKCDLTVTSKIAILEFLKEAFSRIWNHPQESAFKNDLVAKIDATYDKMRKIFDEKILTKLGYEEKLREHQKDALFATSKRKHTLLAFDLGLGKTLIGGSISKMLNIRRTLIICPASLKFNWKMELCGHLSNFNEMYFSILDANKSRTIKAFQERFVICNYDSLEKHMEHILSSPIGHIICDEVVQCKSTSTHRFKMVKKIVDANPDAKLTLLSGRPVRNRCNDLFAYLKLTGHALGHNYASFLRNYIISSKGRGFSIRITGAKNLDILWRQMSNLVLRRRIEDCGDLPPKSYNRLYFNLEDYKSEYDAAVREALEKSGDTSLNSCINRINIVTAKSKLKGVIEFAESIINEGEKLVIFSGYTEIVEHLKNHFGDSAVLINGSVNSFERSERVKRFMEDETCSLFIGNTIAAGMGVTLTKASKMIFMDFPFSPADLAQAEARIYRISQTKPVFIYYAMAKESIDEYIYSIIVDKAHAADMVIDRKVNENSTGNENFSDMLISELRKEYNIPEPIKYVEAENGIR